MCQFPGRVTQKLTFIFLFVRLKCFSSACIKHLKTYTIHGHLGYIMVMEEEMRTDQKTGGEDYEEKFLSLRILTSKTHITRSKHKLRKRPQRIMSMHLWLIYGLHQAGNYGKNRPIESLASYYLRSAPFWSHSTKTNYCFFPFWLQVFKEIYLKLLLTTEKMRQRFQ